VYQAWVIGLMLRIGREETVLFGLPLFHVGGALTQALSWLSAGGCLVVVSPAGWRSPAAQRNVWRLAERYRPASFVGVPTVLTAGLPRAARRSRLRSDARTASASAGRCSRSTA
jgi:fatty-acyl-CoA synthase